MPIITTGYEPSGWNPGLVDERVFAQDPAGTPAQAGYVDGGGPYIFGWDLWGSITIDDLHTAVSQRGMWVYYISLWRDQPAIIGFDNYRAILVYRAGTGG